MGSDWEEDDVDIPVVVEDDQMEAQRALALSDRRAAHARSFMRSLLLAVSKGRAYSKRCFCFWFLCNHIVPRALLLF